MRVAIKLLGLAALTAAPLLVTGTGQSVEAQDSTGEPIAVATEYQPPRSRDDIDPASFSEGDVRAIADRFNISMGDARWRMAVEEASIGLGERLMERWPETYAGHWIAGGGTDPHVVVAFKEDIDAERRKREVEGDFAYPEALRVARVERSFAELRSVGAEIRRDRADLRANRSHENAAIARTRGQFDFSIDLSANTINVSLPEDMSTSEAEETQASFRRHYRAPWLTFSRGVAREACSKGDCRWTMRGGVRLYNDTAVCTSGFGAIGIDRSDYFVLSAGHCGGAWRRNGPTGEGHYGQVYSQQNSGTVDAERIRHETNPWTTQGRVYLQSGDVRSIGSYFGYHAYTEDMTVVMASKDEPAEWGVITDAYADASNNIDMVKANYCTVGGDSGSAVVRNTSALGLAESFGGSCTTSYFTRIYPTMQAMYVNLLAG